MTACEELASEAVNHDVVIVSHVSPIKAAVSWALGGGPEVSWRLSLSVASITRIATGGLAGAALVSFNETAHLDTGPQARGPGVAVSRRGRPPGSSAFRPGTRGTVPRRSPARGGFAGDRVL